MHRRHRITTATQQAAAGKVEAGGSQLPVAMVEASGLKIMAATPPIVMDCSCSGTAPGPVGMVSVGLVDVGDPCPDRMSVGRGRHGKQAQGADTKNQTEEEASHDSLLFGCCTVLFFSFVPATVFREP